MRVWLDLSNSPHPLLFAPIARTLQEGGHEVTVTLRDNAQTLELARKRWPDAELIGGPSPSGRAGKAMALAARVRDLRQWALDRRPAVALSHNSYAQIVAARLVGIPVVTAMDYEHQPANHLAFRLAQAILLPEVLPLQAIRRQGASPRKIIRYAGLKEELYLGDFKPATDILASLGIERGPRDIVVVTRTPPSRAVYHRLDNPLYEETLVTLGGQPRVWIISLARHPEQRDALASLGLPNLTIPTTAIDARSLMYAADAVIGAGGTMTREAALLGLPTFSVFAGRPAAVDAWLEQRGLLTRLESPQQVEGMEPRNSEPISISELRERGQTLIESFVDAVTQTVGLHART